ncbi:hypothetical protein D9758_013264 [Tetrapyrgos nigripes]|uniref:HTH CENPB-type domain-containing protein n=1 Tax=Tetrapyrgos nigripes TaxID=182062 RepID=A0A8H5CNZ0_9AGAR|nr:hypothetical protein D9758_013264 [Tetrapyrgos nigripes]
MRGVCCKLRADLYPLYSHSFPMPPKPPLNLDILDDPDASQEERLQYAVDAMLQDPRRSQRAVAKFYKVPRATLGTRLKGVPTHREAHEHQQNLSNAQEKVVEEWASVRARRGVPLTLSLLGTYAAYICGRELRTTWPRRFVDRCPNLKLKLTTSLEACRAKALNAKLVNEYFDLLESVIVEYHIEPQDIWNMDEKGIQLGVGARIKALVDRDQKSVYSVHSGNRDLITIIEAVNASGKCLYPSFIFEAVKRDLGWGENNPDGASISTSPNGWTDQQLGAMWLEKDFEPNTRPDPSLEDQIKWRLLILDGHNSHCTFRFCNFAEEHRILVICLPPHTTHALQPCNVGVFGPVAKKWKSLVTKLAHRAVDIDKYNVLFYYAAARGSSITPPNVISAFAACGIHPLNRNVITPDMMEPSKNTTTKAALPIPPRFPSFLTPVIDSSQTPSSDDHPVEPSVTGLSVELPKKRRKNATRANVILENEELRVLVEKCVEGMSEMYVHMKLMEVENADLRKRAFDRTTKKKTVYFEGAQLMTSIEMLDALARSTWGAKMKDVFKELQPKFKKIKAAIKAHEKGLDKAAKDAEKKAAQEQKACERAEKQRQVAEEKERKRVEKEKIKEGK